MKKDLKTKLTSRKTPKPNKFLMSFFMFWIGILNKIYKVKFSYDYERKSISKQPTVLLSAHASRLEFLYSVYGLGRKDINVVCGYQNIMKKGLYGILMKLGIISKYLYQPDLLCVKNMIRVLRRGGSLGLFPEGIQSTSGSTHPINPATAQFIKRSKANIVVCTSKGAYLATNRYSPDRKKGYIGINYSLLFTPEMLEALTEEEIYSSILEKISYNDFAYNKVARNKYIGKKPNASGIDNILYKCPDCHKEFALHVKNDSLICDHCGFKVKINEYYDLVSINSQSCPADIDQWYKWQRSCVAEQVKSDDFELTLDGTLCTLRVDKLKKAPKNREILSVGNARLTNRGLEFTGKLNGQDAYFDFNAKSLYSMTFSTRGFLEFYYNNDYFIFIPDKKDTSLVKWTLASEEIHNLYDDKWRAACNDVYCKGNLLWANQQS